MGLWDFWNRHKKKLIVGGITVGVGVYAYRWYTQKRDQLDSLVSIFEDHPLFKQLAGGDDAGEAHFNKMKQVADRRLAKLLPELREALLREFRTKQLQEALARKEGDRASQFRDLQIEYAAQLLASLYAVNLLFLLNRLLGVIAAKKSGAAEDHELFLLLTSSEYMIKSGASKIASRVRAATKRVWEAENLQTTEEVGSERMLALFSKIHAEVWGTLHEE